MRCICCECKTLYNVKEPFEDDSETHGYCDDCLEIVLTNHRLELYKTVEKEAQA